MRPFQRWVYRSLKVSGDDASMLEEALMTRQWLDVYERGELSPPDCVRGNWRNLLAWGILANAQDNIKLVVIGIIGLLGTPLLLLYMLMTGRI